MMIKHTTSHDGTSIGFWYNGRGQPILFVHGTVADHKSWAVLAPRFEPDYAVYALDRRSRGLSGDAPDYDLSREAEDVAAVIAAIGQPVCLFGHSFGGLCSLEAALLTDQVSHLILYEPAVPTGTAVTETAVLAQIEALAEQDEFEAAMILFCREVAHMSEDELALYRRSPLWTERLPLAITIAREMTIEQTVRFDTARFAGLTIPMLLLLGGDSPAIYREGVEMIAAALPHSQIVQLPGQQHIAHHTAPDLLVKEVQRFLFDGR
jgi:pimeloyl-ACP methyl ester carboxylesterase